MFKEDGKAWENNPETQLKNLTIDEFMVAIGNITRKAVRDMFFAGFNRINNCFDDSYKYKSIYDFNLKDTFTLSAEYLKYFNKNEPLVIGYDPGHFSSIVVAQFNEPDNTLYVIKEFFAINPKEQGDIALQG